MRRKWCSVVVMTVLVLGLAGCGAREQQKETAEEKNRADAVVQNAGMTSEEQQRLSLKADIEPGVILTEHCLYTVSDDEEDSGNTVIVQKDHQGNELKRIPLEGVSESDQFYLLDLLCGSDKRIIFSGCAEDGSLHLYSVPVVQTDGGEMVQWEQAEKIAPCYEKELGYAQTALCEPYLIYREDAGTLVRLDMETGDRKTYSIPLTYLELYNFACKDGYLYLVNAKDEDSDSAINFTMHRINFNDGTSEKLYESERQEYPHSLYLDGKFLYMCLMDTANNGSVTDRIECFDLEQKRTVGQLSAREIEEFIQEKVMAGSVEECWEHFYEENFFVYAGRFYMMANTSWLTEKGGDGEAAIPRTVLLSCSVKDLTDLKSEQDLAAWFQKQKCDKTAMGLGGYGDAYYFMYDSYEDQQPKTHLMRYHLDTKQIEEVDHKELIWQGYSASGSWE